MSKHGGFKSIEWAPTGTTTWTDLLRLKEDSSHEPETASEKDSAGRLLYAGEDDVWKLHVYDLTKKAALVTRMKSDVIADQLVDLRITYLDDSSETRLGFSPMIEDPKGFATKARNFFIATFSRFTI
ncbi:MAG: hypothetical protein ABJI69_10160 [Balneola sp.]